MSIIIIPARYESSRFPGKPLVDILGKSLIQRVWGQCVKAFYSDKVFIATDDERIEKHCEENGMQCVMTSDECLTGTDRVAEAFKKIGKPYQTIINVQGDEPLVQPEDILEVAKAHEAGREFYNIVCCGICNIKSEEEFRNPNIVKVVTDYYNRLLYASRASIPTNKDLEFHDSRRQVCIYAFTPSILTGFSDIKAKTVLESVEDIEILRVLEFGYNVQMVGVSESSIAVDVPEDVEKVIRRLS